MRESEYGMEYDSEYKYECEKCLDLCGIFIVNKKFSLMGAKCPLGCQCNPDMASDFFRMLDDEQIERIADDGILLNEVIRNAMNSISDKLYNGAVNGDGNVSPKNIGIDLKRKR